MVCPELIQLYVDRIAVVPRPIFPAMLTCCRVVQLMYNKRLVLYVGVGVCSPSPIRIYGDICRNWCAACKLFSCAVCSRPPAAKRIATLGWFSR